ncbi:MAG: hypothetical protein AAB320_01085 [Elusimicrobiota bacterium]
MRPLLALSLAVLFAGPAAAADEVAALKYEPRCVFEAVSRRMKAPVRPELTAPAVFYASKIKVSIFQAALKAEYGTAQGYDVVTNMFLPKQNAIFLADKAKFYQKGRTLDDSLAHEYTHYFQYYYKGEKDNPQSDQDALEVEAVRVQDWFRQLHVAGGADPCLAPARPRFKTSCVLAMVAKRRARWHLDASKPVPSVLFESETELSRFQDAVEKQWGGRPEMFSNAYSFKTGEVFLIDEAGYYARLKRSPDDSLAHELAHHMQAVYDRADFTQDLNGSYEEEAVDIQTWFRDEVVPAGPSSACAAP